MRNGWKIDLTLAWLFLALALVAAVALNWRSAVADLMIAMLCQELYTLKRPKR